MSLSKVLILMLACCVSACGFKLRGQTHDNASPSLNELNVLCPNTTNWQLCQSLRQHLMLNDIALSEQAEMQLRVSPITQNSRVLSLQQNASAAEYGLSSKVSYQIVSAQSLEVMYENTIQLQHSYRHSSSELLAKERERNELQNELSQQLALEIFRQFQVLNNEGSLLSPSDSRGQPSPDETHNSPDMLIDTDAD